MDFKISVIVPVYQVEKYLKRCVESIINQTYQNLEIILVDDGSKDNSPAICDEYAKKDTRIKVIHQKNSGLAQARNAGIGIATGDYIAFVDSDDMIDLQMFEKMIKLCVENEAELAICEYQRFSSEKDIQPGKGNQKIRTMGKEECLEELYGKNSVTYVVAWNKLYKRELIDGIQFPKGKINEDEFTTYKMIARAEKVMYTDEALYFYYHNGNSITTNSKYVKSQDIFEALDTCIAFYEKKNYTTVKKQAIRAYLFRIVLRVKMVNQLEETDQKLRRFYMKKYRKFYLKNIQYTRQYGIGYMVFFVSQKLYFAMVQMKQR